jgi:MoxR-like ATPase
MAARCHALILGKHAPDIEDVKAVAPSILRHRLVKNYKAEAEGISIDDIIQTFLNSK